MTLSREQAEWAQQRIEDEGLEHLAEVRHLDYRDVRGLSAEVQQKLTHHRPETLGQAARISGVTPAAISLLMVHLKRGFRPLDKKRA